MEEEKESQFNDQYSQEAYENPSEDDLYASPLHY